MRLSRARYVTVCQQSLVTAIVVAVAASAAGVRTLDIVPTPGGARAAVVPDESVLRERVLDRVETAPVTPKVREVKVEAVAAEPRSRQQAQPQPQAQRETQPRSEPTASPEPAVETTTAGRPVVAKSEPVPVDGYGTVGVTWKGTPAGEQYDAEDILVEVRTQDDGVWSGWSTAEYHDDHGPDGTEAARAGERAGTDAVVVGDVDRVQMRASTVDGSAPRDLELAVIDPGIGQTTTEGPALDTAEMEPAQSSGATGAADDTVELSAMKVSAKPTIYSRAQWGANERLRDKGSLRYGTVRTGFVHHTVNANNYSKADVPALLRGIYAYHTQSRGWSDIGYNFLVDRFGRIWEGRYGGVDKAVVGAHTLGYNESSFAMSALGNFETATPPQAMLDAYAKLFAWKLSRSNIRASATGLRVNGKTFRAINGHRDAGSTACPGRYLYAKLPSIRTAAQKIQNNAGGTTAPPPPPPPSTTFTSPTQSPRTWASQPSISYPTGRNLVGSAHPDLAVKRSDGVVQLLPTGGQVAFTPRTATAGSWNKMDLVIGVGDVTGDGRGDVIARHRDTRLTGIYPGDGQGRVATKPLTSTGNFKQARTVAAAGDWNEDGKPDLLAVDRTGALYVWHGRGNGRFTKADRLSADWRAYTRTVVIPDVTGDQVSDLAVLDSSNRITIRPRTSSGIGAATTSRSAGGQVASLAGFPGTAGDLTRDGLGDVAVQRKDNRYTFIHPARESGALATGMGPFTSTSRLSQVSVAPMAGSAQADLIGVDASNGSLVVVRHNGLAPMEAAVTTDVTVPGATQLLSVGDWNGDGRGDLVTRENSGDRLVLRLGEGGGSFRAPVTLSDGWSAIRRLAAVGDVTGDGKADLIGVTRSGGQLRVFPSDGGDGMLSPTTLPSSMRTFNLVGGTTWRPTAAGSRFYNPDGSFVPAAGGIGDDPANHDWVLGVGDLTGDGRSDLVVRSNDGRVWYRSGTASGLGDRKYLTTLPRGTYPLGG